jgi:hypothetical protein
MNTTLLTNVIKKHYSGKTVHFNIVFSGDNNDNYRHYEEAAVDDDHDDLLDNDQKNSSEGDGEDLDDNLSE